MVVLTLESEPSFAVETEPCVIAHYSRSRGEDDISEFERGSIINSDQSFQAGGEAKQTLKKQETSTSERPLVLRQVRVLSPRTSPPKVPSRFAVPS
jgi:hypothetical protein